MPFVLESTTVSPENTSEYFLTVLLNVYTPASSSQSRRLRARLFVDEVEKPIKRATFSTSHGSTDSNLSIELANIADRSAFTRTASIKLEVQEYLTGSWTTIKTYCDGAILATSNYALANNGNNPNDTFSVTVQSVLQQTLNLTPEQFHILYDPAKTTVDDAQLEIVPDIDGTMGSVTVTPVANLNLGDVFQLLADLYELDGFISNINYEQWTLSRVDFPPAQPYWNTVAGIIGNHRPHVSIKNNYLVIEDGTALTTTGAARTMTIGNFKSLTLSKDIQRFKGCIAQRQYDTNWDYYELRKETEIQWYGGVNGQYPKTEIVTWYQDFYRNGVDIPVNSQEFSVRQLEYKDASTLVSATAEKFSYQFGQGGIRMTRNDMKEWGIANVPTSWVTANATIPGPNIEFAGSFGGPEEAYTATNNTTFSEAFVLTQATRTEFNYVPIYGQRDVTFAGQTSTHVKGLITKDTENPQLEEPFEQPYLKAQENGNLASGQDSRWGTTDFRKEVQRTDRKRRVQLRTRRHHQLNSTNGLIAENYHDRRVGDVGESEIQRDTAPVYVREEGDSTATLWRQVNTGEAPIEIWKPLCIRLNKSQDYPGGISADLPTYDESMDIGLVFDPQVEGRTSSMGIYVVEGYTDTLDNVSNGGFKTAITQARQIG
jgi:hypothetical protein